VSTFPPFSKWGGGKLPFIISDRRKKKKSSLPLRQTKRGEMVFTGSSSLNGGGKKKEILRRSSRLGGKGTRPFDFNTAGEDNNPFAGEGGGGNSLNYSPQKGEIVSAPSFFHRTKREKRFQHLSYRRGGKSHLCFLWCFREGGKKGVATGANAVRPRGGKSPFRLLQKGGEKEEGGLLSPG